MTIFEPIFRHFFCLTGFVKIRFQRLPGARLALGVRVFRFIRSARLRTTALSDIGELTSIIFQIRSIFHENSFLKFRTVDCTQIRRDSVVHFKAKKWEKNINFHFPKNRPARKSWPCKGREMELVASKGWYWGRQEARIGLRPGRFRISKNRPKWPFLSLYFATFFAWRDLIKFNFTAPPGPDWLLALEFVVAFDPRDCERLPWAI